MIAGFDPAMFWQLTPRELLVWIDCAGERARAEHDSRAWLAWHIAALSRARKLPRLASLMGKSRRRRSQGWQEQLDIVRTLNAAFGGAVVNKRD